MKQLELIVRFNCSVPNEFSCDFDKVAIILPDNLLQLLDSQGRTTDAIFNEYETLMVEELPICPEVK